MTSEGIESYIRTEAFEWAKRKGNSRAVIPALQRYKLKYAKQLADLGYVIESKKYVDSIKKCLGLNKRESSEHQNILLDDSFVEELDVFEDRIYVSLGLTIESNKNSKESNKVAQALKNVASVLGVVNAKNGVDKNDATEIVGENDLSATSNSDEMNLSFISAASQLPSEKIKSSTGKRSNLSPLHESAQTCEKKIGVTGSTEMQSPLLSKMKNNDLVDHKIVPKPITTNVHSNANTQEQIGSKHHLTNRSEPLSSLSAPSSMNVKNTPIDQLKKGKDLSEPISSPATAPLPKKRTPAPSSGSRKDVKLLSDFVVNYFPYIFFLHSLCHFYLNYSRWMVLEKFYHEKTKSRCYDC